MECLKTQNDTFLQSMTAKWLSALLELSHDRTPSPNSKIVKNLCGYLCCSPSHTPLIEPSSGCGFDDKKGVAISWSDGIISLERQEKVSPFNLLLSLLYDVCIVILF